MILNLGHKMTKIIGIFLLIISASLSASEVKHFWPKIPFNLEGANLCEFRSAYSQTRSQYMREMVGHAKSLLKAGDFNPVATLVSFNKLYNQNLAYAKRGLGVTLEESFKAYLSSYYSKYTPRVRKLEFKYLDRLAAILNINNGHGNSVTEQDINSLDLMAHGSYSLSPNCQGGVFVTMTIIKKDGYSIDYHATGNVRTVMSQIASRVFEDFQRTKFPSTIKVGRRNLTLIGGLNGQVDKTNYLDQAKSICESLDARLPNSTEYKVIDSYGSWSGGISLGRKIWAIDYNQVFVPYFHSAPSRTPSEVNDKTYYYICVR
jgi:hypothetical protein